MDKVIRLENRMADRLSCYLGVQAERGNFVMPENCLFNKNAVGCGGSSYAIESNECWILAVPTVNLIIDKMQKYNADEKDRGFRIAGVYSAESFVPDAIKPSNEDDIRRISSEANPKVTIMCTYDSLDRVLANVMPFKFKLMIDEYHSLLTQYSFRDKAIDKVLEIYDRFRSFVFMSATPIKREFMFEALKELPIVDVEWAEKQAVKVDTKECRNVESAVIQIMKRFYDGIEEGNVYFYINSLKFIESAIKKFNQVYPDANASSKNVRVIYSRNNKAKINIGGEDDKKIIPNGLPKDKPKLFNFITSTAFEGCDIMDENGRTVIVSDGAKAHTMLDISTLCVQIIGRIRNSKYNSRITHLYSKSRYSNMSKEDFDKFSLERRNDSNRCTKEYEVNKAIHGSNSFSNRAIAKDTDVFYSMYCTLDKETDILKFCERKEVLDRYLFDFRSHAYKNSLNIVSAYEKVVGDVTTTYIDEPCFKIALIEERNKMDSLKSCVQEYADWLTEMNNRRIESGSTIAIGVPDSIAERIYSLHPFLEDAFNLLSVDEVLRLSGNKRDVLAAIERVKTKGLGVQAQVYSMVKTKLNPISGGFYACAQIKKVMQNIYDELGLNKKANATDLNEFY